MSRETDPVLSGMSGTIAGYRLDGYIGRGDLAVVYLAQDERVDRKVALKILAPGLAHDEVFRARFLSDSQAVAEIDHPNIIPVYEVGEANGALYVAMRYVQGGDARSLLNRLGPLPTAWAWNIIAQVAAGLDAAHARGLIHGDVKPASMLLSTSADDGRAPRRADGGDFDHVYLSDFGMTKDPPSDPAATGQYTGRLDYAAPEQIEGRPLDGRADLYSLACAGYELLCGAPPFGQDQGLTVMYAQLYAPPPSAAAQRPELPGEVDRVLANALAKNPADRYASCSQFADELHAALGLLPAQPSAPAPWQSPGYAQPVADPGLPPGGPGLPPGGPGLGPQGPGPRRRGPGAGSQGPGSAPGGPDQGLSGIGLGAGTPGQDFSDPGPGAGSPGRPPGDPTLVPGDPTLVPGDPRLGAGDPRLSPDAGGQAGPGEFDATQAWDAAPYDSGWSSTQGWQQPVAGPNWASQHPTGGPGWPNQQPAGGPGWPNQQPAGGPGWPNQQPAGGPGWPNQQPAGGPGASFGPLQRIPGGKRLVFAAAAAVVVIVVIIVAVALSAGSKPGKSAASSSASSAPQSAASGLASRQAAAVTNLLDSSSAARKGLQGAVDDVRNCKSLPGAVSQIHRVVRQRSAEDRQAAALSTAALANGAVVKSDLIKALRDSLSADRDYLSWAEQQLRSGCTPVAQSGAYNAAFTADEQAAASKQAFVQVWNPLAARYGARQETPGNI
jgi:serine/threonine-protein kinase